MESSNTAHVPLHLAVDSYALISLIKTQQSSESTDFLSSESHSSKLIKPWRVSWELLISVSGPEAQGTTWTCDWHLKWAICGTES